MPLIKTVLMHTSVSAGFQLRRETSIMWTNIKGTTQFVFRAFKHPLLSSLLPTHIGQVMFRLILLQ